MHHDKLEEFCIQEKNLLLNLVMLYQKSTVFLLEKESDTKNDEDKNIINKINEIKKFKVSEDLKNDLNNILIQSKVVFNNAINQDQYQDLIDDNIN